MCVCMWVFVDRHWIGSMDMVGGIEESKRTICCCFCVVYLIW